MKTLKEKLESISKYIGNTPMYKLDVEFCNLYTKLEYFNFFGSIKDRPAHYILKRFIESDKLNSDTTIIESSSGNFAIALAGMCKILGIPFIPVIDPNISPQKKKLLESISANVIVVDEKDVTGNYLLNRIKKVKEYSMEHQNVLNPNQYDNVDNYLSYYFGLGKEIADYFPTLDYAFITVSTGGTIAGISKRLKEKFPNINIVAVDVEGSFIFDNKVRERKLFGIGASLRTKNIEFAKIDKIVILSQDAIIDACHELLTDHSILVGASAGAAYCAAKKVLEKRRQRNTNAVFITPDNGSSYLDTVYNEEWVLKNIKSHSQKLYAIS